MCVITICKNKREKQANLEQMAIDNPDGTGAIWYDSKEMPTYQKGLTIKEVIELNKTLPFPYAFHFRITTVGINKLLTHPYEVTKESELKMEGQAEALLMHNGHWSDWNEAVLNHSINTGQDCPDGDWSDSRAMAYLSGVIGPNMLKMLSGQKIAVFKKNKKITILGAGWEIEKDILYSNKNWEKTKSKWGYGYGKCNTKTGYWFEGAFYPDGNNTEALNKENKAPAIAWDPDKKEWAPIKKEIEKMQDKKPTLC